MHILGTLWLALQYLLHAVGHNDSVPLVVVATPFKNAGHILSYYLASIEGIDYPRNRMLLNFHLAESVDETKEILTHWCTENWKQYADVTIDRDNESSTVPQDDKDCMKSRIKRLSLFRQNALIWSTKVGADFLFFLDADNFLTEPETLQQLIAVDKLVVAPLLRYSVRSASSNFRDTDTSGNRTEKHFEILERDYPGIHKVSHLSQSVLIKLGHEQSQRLTFEYSGCTSYVASEWEIFGESVKALGEALYVLNAQTFGLLVGYKTLCSQLDVVQDAFATVQSELVDKNFGRLEGVFDERPHGNRRVMQGLDAIYYINLDTRPERREHMETLFDTFGIAGNRIQAVDGKLLNESYLVSIGVSEFPGYFNPGTGHVIKKGEVGCFLSHHKIWEMVIDLGYENVLILEDDATFAPLFTRSLRSLLKEIERVDLDFDLIYIGKFPLDGIKCTEKPINETDMLVEAGYYWLAVGYILSRRGALKLLNNEPLNKMVPVDEYFAAVFGCNDMHPEYVWDMYYKHRDLKVYSTKHELVKKWKYWDEDEFVSDTAASEKAFAEIRPGFSPKLYYIP